MSAFHPDDTTLVAYVDGTLVAQAAEQLEAHVIACSGCAQRLSRCAWIETAMFEAAAHIHPPRPARSWGRRLERFVQMPAGLALAASMVLGLGVPARWLELDADANDRVARAEVGDGHGSTPWDEAPACAVPEDTGGETCDDPTMGDELIAMTWPEPGDEICVDAELACADGGEPRDG